MELRAALRGLLNPLLTDRLLDLFDRASTDDWPAMVLAVWMFHDAWPTTAGAPGSAAGERNRRS